MLSRFPYRNKKIDLLFFIHTEDNTQQQTMPKITKSDKIAVLNYVININVPEGKGVYYTNLSKAKVAAIDKLLEKHGVNDANFDEYVLQMRKKYRERKLIREENDKIVYEKSKMEDEDLLSQFNSVPDAIKVLCEKKRQYEDYVSHLKTTKRHIKDAEFMFSKVKRSNLDTITWRDGNAELIVNGINIQYSHLGAGRWRHTFGGIHRQTTTKEIIEDYENGLISVLFKIKVKKNRSKKRC